MAQAARIFEHYQNELPGLSDSCISAAVKAWEWAEKNPDVEYNQQKMNRQYDPEVNTGAYGDKTPMHPHHRLSVADGVREPAPGLLAGGPNARAASQDECDSYTSTVAEEVYTDDDCSYASNEIAINWNAPYVYLASALEALQSSAGFSAK